jgi:hypothetical protein
VLDGFSRPDAARMGGMDRQTLQDWDTVQRVVQMDCCTTGPAAARLSVEQRARLAVIIDAVRTGRLTATGLGA